LSSLRTAKLLADENIPRDVRDWFTQKGFQVIDVSEINLKSAKDFALAQYAEKHKLPIVTLDKGFAKIYRMFKRGTFAVIILKAKPAQPSNIIEALELASAKLNLKEIGNKLVIITKNRVRVIV